MKNAHCQTKNSPLTPEPTISRQSQLSSNVAALSPFILALNAPHRPQFKQATGVCGALKP